MEIKLKELKGKIYNGALLNYRLFQMFDACVNVDSLPLLWETKNNGDWANIGDNKFDDYYVQELQTNKENTLDILISRNPGIRGDSK